MHATSPTLQRRVVLLLAAAVFLNYFDRGALSIAAPLLQGELALTPAQLGILFSAFFWSYAPMQPLAGWLAQRVDVRIVLGSGLALWGLATLLTGFANGFWMLLALRVLLGIGESVFYPCNHRFLGAHITVAERGRANGIVATGQALGPLVGTLGGGLLMAEHGWRPAFLLFGALSLAWLWPWHVVTRGGLTAVRGGGDAPVSWSRLLSERSLWGTSLGHFCGNYAYYFMLTWLPLLLVREHGLDMARMAMVGAGVYALQAVAAPSTGWLCDRLVARGHDVDRVLKGIMNFGLCGAAAAMAGCAFAGPETTIGLILVAGIFFGMQSAPLGAISQTIGGVRAAGQWMGVQNFCANFAGVLAPLITGFVVERTGQFLWAFAIAAAVTLVGVIAFGVVVRRVAPAQW